MISTPSIIQTEAQATAVIHITTPRGEMMKVFGPAVGELMATQLANKRRCVAATGQGPSCFSRTYS